MELLVTQGTEDRQHRLVSARRARLRWMQRVTYISRIRVTSLFDLLILRESFTPSPAIIFPDTAETTARRQPLKSEARMVWLWTAPATSTLPTQIITYEKLIPPEP